LPETFIAVKIGERKALAELREKIMEHGRGHQG